MIEINNLTTNPVDKEFLKKVAKKVLEEENKSEASLSIALVGQGRIRELNRKYREENRVTDVLAFPFRKRNRKEKEFIEAPLFIKCLGEVVICYPQVKKQAKILGHSIRKELTILLIHGILHLVGYSDKTEEDRKRMEVKTERILSSLDI